MKFIDLSHPLRDGLPSFPGDPSLSIVVHAATTKGDKCNVSRIATSSHMGTHLDAQFHFIPDGKRIDEMPLEWFYGPAKVLRIPKAPREEITIDDMMRFEKFLVPDAKVIFETGWHRHYGQADYYIDFPSMTQEAATYVAGRQIRLLGLDVPTPSRDYYEVHHILQQKPAEIVIVESLANLNSLPENILFIGFPLRFAGGDGSPIRAVAGIDP